MNWIIKNLPLLFACAVYAVLRYLYADHGAAISVVFLFGGFCGILYGLWPTEKELDADKAKREAKKAGNSEGTCNACGAPILWHPSGRWIHKRMADSRCPTPSPRPRSK